ncbi:hypothetical protein [Streptomyces sp. NBC_00503]|uniref:hypothetical protein n=1 Tax=Streptomyces sp. NBC_00503 TaxID=2903659 RepID=UPI002E8191B4|nr:hypothetical protein [Streptomyces sp. NBC_00503]WUD85464.1 hypothetical protein OG490_35640 [Streptomyces sp. NBC_00503]
MPGWVSEGTPIFDPLENRRGIVQFIGEYEDATTRVSYANAVFARPEGSGLGCIVEAPSSPEHG